MAEVVVDKDEIGLVYDTLETKVTGTIGDMFDNYEISSTDKAMVLSNAINTIIQSSVASIKMQKEIDSMDSEDARRELTNAKDLEVKDAQKTLTYRDAMIKEQQQLLLANQTSYESQKTSTLEDNTEANMLIRTIDGGVSEINGYLTNGVVPPTPLLNVVSQARYDLLELSGATMSDYASIGQSVLALEGTSDTGASIVAVYRGLDNAVLDATNGHYSFLLGDRVSYTDTNDGVGTGVYVADADIDDVAFSALDLSSGWTKE